MSIEENNTQPAQTLVSLHRLSTNIKPKFKLNTIAYRLVQFPITSAIGGVYGDFTELWSKNVKTSIEDIPVCVTVQIIYSDAPFFKAFPFTSVGISLQNWMNKMC